MFQELRTRANMERKRSQRKSIGLFGKGTIWCWMIVGRKVCSKLWSDSGTNRCTTSSPASETSEQHALRTLHPSTTSISKTSITRGILQPTGSCRHTPNISYRQTHWAHSRMNQGDSCHVGFPKKTTVARTMLRVAF